MSASAAPLFTEEHQRAICEACEKLWNGLPSENPIYAPRPEGHPLRIVANKAHEALNAALAMETQYLQAAAKLAAAEAALAACEADTARLDWLEANCDMILNHEQLTQDEYRSPAVICCLPEDRPLRESIDAWLAPRP